MPSFFKPCMRIRKKKKKNRKKTKICLESYIITKITSTENMEQSQLNIDPITSSRGETEGTSGTNPDQIIPRHKNFEIERGFDISDNIDNTENSSVRVSNNVENISQNANEPYPPAEEDSVDSKLMLLDATRNEDQRQSTKLSVSEYSLETVGSDSTFDVSDITITSNVFEIIKRINAKRRGRRKKKVNPEVDIKKESEAIRNSQGEVCNTLKNLPKDSEGDSGAVNDEGPCQKNSDSSIVSVEQNSKDNDEIKAPIICIQSTAVSNEITEIKGSVENLVENISKEKCSLPNFMKEKISCKNTTKPILKILPKEDIVNKKDESAKNKMLSIGDGIEMMKESAKIEADQKHDVCDKDSTNDLYELGKDLNIIESNEENSYSDEHDSKCGYCDLNFKGMLEMAIKSASTCSSSETSCTNLHEDELLIDEHLISKDVKNANFEKITSEECNTLGRKCVFNEEKMLLTPTSSVDSVFKDSSNSDDSGSLVKRSSNGVLSSPRSTKFKCKRNFKNLNGDYNTFDTDETGSDSDDHNTLPKNDKKKSIEDNFEYEKDSENKVEQCLDKDSCSHNEAGNVSDGKKEEHFSKENLDQKGKNNIAHKTVTENNRRNELVIANANSVEAKDNCLKNNSDENASFYLYKKCDTVTSKYLEEIVPDEEGKYLESEIHCHEMHALEKFGSFKEESSTPIINRDTGNRAKDERDMIEFAKAKEYVNDVTEMKDENLSLEFTCFRDTCQSNFHNSYQLELHNNALSLYPNKLPTSKFYSRTGDMLEGQFSSGNKFDEKSNEKSLETQSLCDNKDNSGMYKKYVKDMSKKTKVERRFNMYSVSSISESSDSNMLSEGGDIQTVKQNRSKSDSFIITEFGDNKPSYDKVATNAKSIKCHRRRSLYKNKNKDIKKTIEIKKMKSKNTCKQRNPIFSNTYFDLSLNRENNLSPSFSTSSENTLRNKIVKSKYIHPFSEVLSSELQILNRDLDEVNDLCQKHGLPNVHKFGDYVEPKSGNIVLKDMEIRRKTSIKAFNKQKLQAISDMRPELREITIHKTESFEIKLNNLENNCRVKTGNTPFSKFQRKGSDSSIEKDSGDFISRSFFRKNSDIYRKELDKIEIQKQVKRAHKAQLPTNAESSEKSSETSLKMTPVRKRVLEASRAIRSPKYPVKLNRKTQSKQPYPKKPFIFTKGDLVAYMTKDDKRNIYQIKKGYKIRNNDFEKYMICSSEKKKGKPTDFRRHQTYSKIVNRAMSPDDLRATFDDTFKRYASKGRKNGELMSYKRSTEWLRDAGVIGKVLTADEATDAFKCTAGVKIALNKCDYRHFLMKLTRLKRLNYNEIYERLCSASNKCIDVN